LARPVLVSVASIVSIVFGILSAFAGASLIPSLGLYPRDPGSKVLLLSIIGAIGLIGGVLFLASAIGVWKVARWGWIGGIAASILALVSGLWASITVVDLLMPVAQIFAALLMVGLLAAARSSFRPLSATPPSS